MLMFGENVGWRAQRGDCAKNPDQNAMTTNV
jgi:hypothetical protein